MCRSAGHVGIANWQPLLFFLSPSISILQTIFWRVDVQTLMLCIRKKWLNAQDGRTGWLESPLRIRPYLIAEPQKYRVAQQVFQEIASEASYVYYWIFTLLLSLRSGCLLRRGCSLRPGSIHLLKIQFFAHAFLQKKADKQEIDTATLKSSLRTIQDLSQAIHKLWWKKQASRAYNTYKKYISIHLIDVMI